MLSVNYDAAFSRFLAQVQAYDLVMVDEVEARQKLNEWLISVKSNPRVRKLFTSLSFDKNIETISFELKNSLKDEDSDKDFVTEVFGIGVAWKWASEKYNSYLNTAQYFGSGEKKFYSQQAHATALATMAQQSKSNLFGFIRDHGSYNNAYVEGES